MKKNYIIFFLGLIISIIFVYLLLRNIDFFELWNTLKNINVIYLLLAIIFAVIDLYFRAYKWKTILVDKVNLNNASKSFFFGFALNSIFPFRLGDIGRTFVIKKNIAIRQGLGAVIFERIIEGLTLVFCFALVLFLFAQKSSFLYKIFYLVLIIFTVALLCLIILLLFRDLLINLLKRIKLKSLADTCNLVVSGFENIKNIDYFVKVIILTFIMWLISFFMFYFVSLALNLKLSFYIVMFCVIMLNFAIILPSAPGGIGLVEYVLMLTLGLFTITNSFALSFAILIRLILTLQGLLSIYLVGFGIFKDFYEKENK